VRMTIPHLIGASDFQKKKMKWPIRWFFGFLMVLTPEFHFAIHYKVVRMTIPDLIGISDFQTKMKKWATVWFSGFLLVLTQAFRFPIHYKVGKHLIDISHFKKKKDKWEMILY
jgi:hypothetical protein